jgi:hypothetical protein
VLSVAFQVVRNPLCRNGTLSAFQVASDKIFQSLVGLDAPDGFGFVGCVTSVSLHCYRTVMLSCRSARYLTKDCLFGLPTYDASSGVSVDLPVCKSDQCRAAAFGLLQALCRANTTVQLRLLRDLKQLARGRPAYLFAAFLIVLVVLWWMVCADHSVREPAQLQV